MNNLFKKVLTLSVIAGLLVPSIPTKALEVGMAVSPSKVYDEQLDYGESKEFTFFVANKSKDLPEGSSNMTISIEPSIEDEFGQEVENPSRFISFDVDQVTVDVEKEAKVKATIKMPDSSEELLAGNYSFYVKFIQNPIEGLSISDQTSALRVPVMLYLGSEEDYNSFDVDFTVIDSHVTVGKVEPTTVLNECLANCKKVLNPFRTLDVIRDIIERPNYVFKADGKTILDLSDKAFVQLDNVIVENEKDLGDRQYVVCPKEWFKESIMTCKNNKTSISISLENSEELTINGKPSSIAYVYEQIKTLAQDNPNATVSDLAKTLKVPSNVNFEKEETILNCELENGSDISVTLKGQYTLKKNGTEEVAKDKLTSPSIKPGESGELNYILTTKDLSDGDYELTGDLKFRNESQDLSNKFTVKSERQIIIASVILFEVFYIAIILGIIIFVFKKLFCKKPELLINGSKVKTVILKSSLSRRKAKSGRHASKNKVPLTILTDESITFTVKNGNKLLDVVSWDVYSLTKIGYRLLTSTDSFVIEDGEIHDYKIKANVGANHSITFLAKMKCSKEVSQDPNQTTQK